MNKSEELVSDVPVKFTGGGSGLDRLFMQLENPPRDRDENLTMPPLDEIVELDTKLDCKV